VNDTGHRRRGGDAWRGYATTTTTSDLDQARAALSAHFYPTHLDALPSPSPLRAQFDVAVAGAVTIGDLTFGATVRARFGDLGAYHVDVPVAGRFVSRHGDGPAIAASAGCAPVFRPVGDTTIERWEDDCRMLAVKIDQRFLENELARMLDAPVVSPVRFAPCLDTSAGPGASWLRLLRLVQADIGRGDGLAHHPLLGERLQESLAAGLLLAAGHQYRDLLDHSRRLLPAPRSVRRAIDAMHADPGGAYTLTALAEIAGVSRRSLQQGFQQYVGVSPMSYLRQVRLARVHDDLRASGPADASVTDVAYRYGFVHLGRFAGAYRARYGRSPSETLRR